MNVCMYVCMCECERSRDYKDIGWFTYLLRSLTRSFIHHLLSPEGDDPVMSLGNLREISPINLTCHFFSEYGVTDDYVPSKGTQFRIFTFIRTFCDSSQLSYFSHLTPVIS